MSMLRPDVAELLDVAVPDGGHVIAVSDLHLPPERTTVSARCCEILSRRLNAQAGPVTVVLAGDVVELLSFPEATAADILGAHDDLCAALKGVTERGGQVVYTIGNHDGDLAWDIKSADAVRDATGAKLCLAADLVLPGTDTGRVRIEHGHQLDPYNCFHDPTNPLDTPLGHHIVREVVPRIEWLGRDWLNGAHEMADPADFPSFLASRLVYRKLARHTWWLILLPVLLLVALSLSPVVYLRQRYPDTGRWLHDFEILGYGAVVDLALIALIVAIVTRRAWTSISALALAGRGYSQNHGAQQRAADLVADGYAGFISGHTHHPELRHSADGFYANTGSCTSVVEAIDTVRGIPPVYLRTQQISWLELTAVPSAGSSAPAGSSSPYGAMLKSARVVLPGASRLERLAASGRSPHTSAPCRVANWPDGPDWPPAKRTLRRPPKKAISSGEPPSSATTDCRG
jgi:UDP-2,3-diacylglucosamine pyrophosphatase LpxH